MANSTNRSRAARRLQELSDLTYAQALEKIRAAKSIPFLGTTKDANEFLERTDNKTLDSVVWVDLDGEFVLRDGSVGNPGCDECGEYDAVVCINGTYLCEPAAAERGVPDCESFYVESGKGDRLTPSTFDFAWAARAAADAGERLIAESIEEGTELVCDYGVPTPGWEPTGPICENCAAPVMVLKPTSAWIHCHTGDTICADGANVAEFN